MADLHRPGGYHRGAWRIACVIGAAVALGGCYDHRDHYRDHYGRGDHQDRGPYVHGGGGGNGW
ncbi:hypothetical protein GDI0841 [Gluconacetobacter diazotrophicus PA1 5]|uniref:Lipoprotein n=1 Tax=Gluconacetobacter diazotrophicus (strain ATCC 49037 / DSM 5601 / CCUG 37298 / CIP 103539 / LMG 7603 / PAl5) TaxID=272568 RepID=A9HB93_GLUDA|nr:hypothetical protein GDI0841 [Gluconacetobacter diazotrophicus PA1 5]